MVKKMTQLPTAEAIEQAAAVFLVTKETPCTAKQCVKELAKALKKLVGHEGLTVQEVRNVLRKWVSEGWATLANNVLQITRIGRARIKSLAEEATSPAPAM